MKFKSTSSFSASSSYKSCSAMISQYENSYSSRGEQICLLPRPPSSCHRGSPSREWRQRSSPFASASQTPSPSPMETWRVHFAYYTPSCLAAWRCKSCNLCHSWCCGKWTYFSILFYLWGCNLKCRRGGGRCNVVWVTIVSVLIPAPAGQVWRAGKDALQQARDTSLRGGREQV